MCVAVPGVIVAIEADRQDLVQVDVGGTRYPVRLGLQENEVFRPGDWVLVYAGFVLSKIDEAEAKAALELLEAMNQVGTDELQTLGV